MRKVLLPLTLALGLTSAANAQLTLPATGPLPKGLSVRQTQVSFNPDGSGSTFSLIGAPINDDFSAVGIDTPTARGFGVRGYLPINENGQTKLFNLALLTNGLPQSLLSESPSPNYNNFLGISHKIPAINLEGSGGLITRAGNGRSPRHNPFLYLGKKFKRGWNAWTEHQFDFSNGQHPVDIFGVGRQFGRKKDWNFSLATDVSGDKPSFITTFTKLFRH